MTGDEVMRQIFPKAVADQAKKEAEESKKGAPRGSRK
jgi:hypothetical protein